jgi:hypothetical protein
LHHFQTQIAWNFFTWWHVCHFSPLGTMLRNFLFIIYRKQGTFCSPMEYYWGLHHIHERVDFEVEFFSLSRHRWSIKCYFVGVINPLPTDHKSNRSSFVFDRLDLDHLSPSLSQIQLCVECRCCKQGTLKQECNNHLIAK